RRGAGAPRRCGCAGDHILDLGSRPGEARLRATHRLARGCPSMALGARCREGHALPTRGVSARMRVLLVMDPFIRVPPEHYGGIERLIADLADGLAAAGHDVTLWAAPGSQVSGQVDPY